MFDNAEPIPLEGAVKRLKDMCPGLLLEGGELEDERVDMGFKTIRDEYYFTSHRILIIDVQGITGKKVKYLSIPYHSIKAFSVETAGGMFDSDSELQIYGGSTDLKLEFNKKKVNIFDVQKYVSRHVFVDSGEELQAHNEPTPYKTETKAEGGKSNRLLDYLAGDAVRLDQRIVEEELRSIGAMIHNENIKLAYKCGRDMVICSSKRMLWVDTKGFSGKKVNYLSMRYSCIKAYEVETAGSFFDRDAELRIYTDISQEWRCIQQDLRKGQSDIMEVLWYFNNQILGMATKSTEQYVPLTHSSGGANMGSLMSWLGDDMSQIDASQADRQFHTSPPILQANEVCEIAFQGRRDLVLFTTKRILKVDKQGWKGKKMSFLSFPYSSIKMFQVTTAGNFDKDCELGFYTEIWYDPPKCSGCEDGCGDEKPTPGMSFIEIDMTKNTDILAVHRYVAAKVHRIYAPSNAENEHMLPANQMILQPSPPGALNNFLNYMGQNFSKMDPKQIEASLSMGGESPVLINDEKVLMAFKCGRDSTVFTSNAILDVDVQGFTGKKVEFRSIPYSTIRRFATTSAGTFDTDSELHLAFSTPWLDVVDRDFRSGKADIVAIQNLIAAKTLGAPGKPSDFANDNTITKSNPGSMSQLLAYIKDKHLQMDPNAVEQQFKTQIPILQTDEKVELAFKSGRDMFLITNKRVIFVDVQGLRGKKVEFYTIPYKYVTGFAVKSAGALSLSVQATLYCSKLDKGLKTKLGKKDTDIFKINNSLGNKILA